MFCFWLYLLIKPDFAYIKLIKKKTKSGIIFFKYLKFSELFFASYEYYIFNVNELTMSKIINSNILHIKK